MFDAVVDEESTGNSLPNQSTLHVTQGADHSVNLAVIDELAQRGEVDLAVRSVQQLRLRA
jgi:hypothetical protein